MASPYDALSDKAKCERLYAKHGTLYGIGQELGVSDKTVAHWFRKHGLTWARSNRNAAARRKQAGPETQSPFEALLAILKMVPSLSLVAAANKLDVSPARVEEMAGAARLAGYDVNFVGGAAVALSRQYDARMQMHVHDFYGSHFRIGLLSDTHWGSSYEAQDELMAFYEFCRKSKVEALYHAGDITAGINVYRGQIRELREECVGVDAQVERAAAMMMAAKMPVSFILGNHDRKVYADTGMDIGKRVMDIAKAAGHKHPVTCLGHEHARVLIGKRDCAAVLDLIHPGGGSAYAVSYRPQKVVESYSGGDKPHIVVIGHFHKAEMLPHVRNMVAIQPGAFEWQTPFMRRKQLEAHVAGCVLEGWMEMVDGQPSLARIRTEYLKFYLPRGVAAG